MSNIENKHKEMMERLIHPLMPTKFSAVERARLREFERKLLTGSDDPNVKPDGGINGLNIGNFDIEK